MNKNTIIAVAVFGLLAAVGLNNMGKKRERGITRINFSQVNVDSVDTIKLSGKHTATLSKAGDKWTVMGGKRADEAAVKRLLDTIPKINSSSLITSDSERFEEFEVTDAEGTRVLASAGGTPVAEFVVGKGASGGVHLRADNEVYVVAKVYASAFAKDGGDWIDKKIFDAKVADLTKVEVALKAQQPYTLVKGEKDWGLEDASTLPAGFRFDAAAAKRLVTSLVNLRAKTFVASPEAPETGLDATADRLTFFAGSAKQTVRFGLTQESEVFAQAEGGDLFKVHESTVKGLRKAPTDFRDLGMTDIDKDKVVALKAVDGRRSIELKKTGSDWALGKSTEPVSADFSLDSAAVSRKLAALSNAKGTGVAEGITPAAAGLKGSRTYLEATLDDGKKVRVTFGKQTKVDDRDVLYASGNADTLVYHAGTYLKSNLVFDLESLKKREKPPGLSGIDPSALQNLPPDVRKQLEQQIAQQQAQEAMMQKIQASQN